MRDPRIVEGSDQASGAGSNPHGPRYGKHRPQRDNRADARNRKRDEHRQNSYPATQ